VPRMTAGWVEARTHGTRGRKSAKTLAVAARVGRERGKSARAGVCGNRRPRHGAIRTAALERVLGSSKQSSDCADGDPKRD